jgi:phage gp36-like protein
VTYATLAGLTDRFGLDLIVQLTDRAAAPTGMVDAGVVARALADADAVIDASLAVRYRLPLDSVPAIVVDIALSIAIYKLHRFAPDPKIKDDYDQAQRDLREIAAGTKRLDVAGIAPVGSGAGGVVTTDRARPLTPETLTGFV